MIEVDFLPASGKKSGDCILIRFGSFSYDKSQDNRQKVVMIDSGYKECAEKIETHLKKYYNTNEIDYVILTHPDLDHISGLKQLLDDGRVHVKKIVAHDPWSHASFVRKKLNDGRRTERSIEKKFDDLFTVLGKILDYADDFQIPCFEMFSGEKITIGDFRLDILGPSKEYYELLLKKITDQALAEAQTTAYDILGDEVYSFQINRFFLENPQTSPKNASSMILLLSYKNKPYFLFTGDAGNESIKKAVQYAKSNGINIKDVCRMQLPHHGSLKNISKDVLSYINAGSYVVSASLNEEETKESHPSKLLTNYIVSREGKRIFHATEKHGIRISWGAPQRFGWSAARPKQKNLKLRKLKGDD